MRCALALLAQLVVTGSVLAQGVPAAAGASSHGTYGNPFGSRGYTVYRPAALATLGGKPAIVVVLHGCGQGADDIAKGTRMNAAADANGFIVVYPEQTAAAHPLRCWNWYSPSETTRGHGEVAILAGLVDSIATATNAGSVSLVGMSAGAAMAAQLAVAYPERYAALALHSGVAALAANDATEALGAMREGPTQADALGAKAVNAMGARTRGIPVILFHGADDKVVSPSNLRALAQQWRVIDDGAYGRAALVEEHLIPGVGHAWSGGAPDATYTAPNAPDATAMIVDFLHRVGALPTTSK